MSDYRQTNLSSEGASSSLSKKCRVLIIEDNHDAADSLAMLLEILGFEVKKGSSGLSVLRS